MHYVRIQSLFLIISILTIAGILDKSGMSSGPETSKTFGRGTEESARSGAGSDLLYTEGRSASSQQLAYIYGAAKWCMPIDPSSVYSIRIKFTNFETSSKKWIIGNRQAMAFQHSTQSSRIPDFGARTMDVSTNKQVRGRFFLFLLLEICT